MLRTFLIIFFMVFLLFACGKKTPENVFLPLSLGIEIADRCDKGVGDKELYLSLVNPVVESDVRKTTTDEKGIASFSESPRPYILNFKERKGNKDLYFTILSDLTFLKLNYGFETSSCSPTFLTFPFSISAEGNDIIDLQRDIKFYASTIPGNYSEEITDFEPGKEFYVSTLFFPERNSSFAFVFHSESANGYPDFFFYYSSITYGGLPSGANNFFVKNRFNFSLNGGLFQSETHEENLMNSPKIKLFTGLSVRGKANINSYFQEISAAGKSFSLLLPDPNAFKNDPDTIINAGGRAEERNNNLVRVSWRILKIKPFEVTGYEKIERDIVFEPSPGDFNIQVVNGEYNLVITYPANEPYLIIRIFNEEIEWWSFLKNNFSNLMPLPFNPYLEELPRGEYDVQLIYLDVSPAFILTRIPSSEEEFLEVLLSSSSDVNASIIQKKLKF